MWRDQRPRGRGHSATGGLVVRGCSTYPHTHLPTHLPWAAVGDTVGAATPSAHKTAQTARAAPPVAADSTAQQNAERCSAASFLQRAARSVQMWRGKPPGEPSRGADVAGVRPDVAVRLSSPTACGPVGSAQRIRFAFANGLRCATVERTARRGGTLLGGGRGCAKNIGSSGATRCGLHTKTDSESIERQSTVRALRPNRVRSRWRDRSASRSR